MERKKVEAGASLKPDHKEILKQLARLGGLTEDVVISSGELAKRLGTSQQTASRKILELLREGLLVRRMGARRQLLRISDAGGRVLFREFAEYQGLFEKPARVELAGVVSTGLGEGQYYVTRKGYADQFQAKLGFTPYPGTLNLTVDRAERERLFQLSGEYGIPIEGFVTEDRTFGGARCLLASVADVPGAVILPLRTHHADVLELISPHRLRERLQLKDGDSVSVVVSLPR
ncbi:MAG: DUF120 domain-containing protein [Methanobacteriota archaeon]